VSVTVIGMADALRAPGALFNPLAPTRPGSCQVMLHILAGSRGTRATAHPPAPSRPLGGRRLSVLVVFHVVTIQLVSVAPRFLAEHTSHVGKRRHDEMRALALGGVVGPAIFVLALIASSILREDYSQLHDFVSELGATGTSNAGLMNVAGFIPAGVCVFVFGVALTRLVATGPMGIVAGLLTAAFGIGIAVAGIYSCDAGCPRDGSIENLVHDRVSPLAFLLAILGCALWGLHLRRTGRWGSLWAYSLATSGLALVFFALLAQSLEAQYLTGLWQRLLLVCLFAWCTVFGIKAHHSSGAGSRAPSP